MARRFFSERSSRSALEIESYSEVRPAARIEVMAVSIAPRSVVRGTSRRGTSRTVKIVHRSPCFSVRCTNPRAALVASSIE